MEQEKTITEQFLEAINEIDIVLLALSFKRHSSDDKGLACFITYRKKNNTRVKFLFGPSDWEIEMIIYTSRGEFAFRDLFIIPEILLWINNNRSKRGKKRNLKKELGWCIELLKVSLPYIE